MILSSLYLGNICPAEDSVSEDPEFRTLNQKIVAALKPLESKLNEEQTELFRQFYQRITDLNCYETEAKFKYGFALGMQMMQEIQTFDSVLKR